MVVSPDCVSDTVRGREEWIQCSGCVDKAYEEFTDFGVRNFAFICQSLRMSRFCLVDIYSL